MWNQVVQRSRSFLQRHIAVTRPQLLHRLRRSFSNTPSSSTTTGAGVANAAKQQLPKRPTSYAPAIAAFHWLTGGTILTCFAFVELAKRKSKDDPRRVQLMNIHKSFGLLAMGLVTARVLRRFVFIDKILHLPGPLPGVPKPLHVASDITHIVLYSTMIFMPLTGIIMGYYGGKGLPFFGYRIPGIDEPNKKIAGSAFKAHKVVGKAMEIIVGLHISASLFHHFSGHKIYERITKFSMTGLVLQSIESDRNGIIRSNYEDLLMDGNEDEDIKDKNGNINKIGCWADDMKEVDDNEVNGLEKSNEE